MAGMPARSRRIVGLALVASAGILVGMALAISTGLVTVGDEIKGMVAAVLGGVAAVDLLLGFWFLRSSLSA